MNISVCIIIRNKELYMKYFIKLFNKIETIYSDYIFEYFIYENNSIDNTKVYIKEFFKNKNGKFLIEDIHNNKMKDGISLERGEHKCNLRNRLKEFHKYLSSDYTLLLDSDVVFLPNTIIDLINTLNEDTVMASPYCICYYEYNKNSRIHYYDSLAVISEDNISYNENNNTCLFKNCERCINFRKNININITDNKLFDEDKIIKVKSAFGSMSIIKTEIYNKVKWDKTVCEHFSFCENIRKYGDIVINSSIKTFTTTSEFEDYDDIENTLKNISNKNT